MKCSAKKKKGFAEGSRRAGYRALFQKLLSFILSLCIIFAVSPTTVFAKDLSISSVECTVFAGGKVPINSVNQNIPCWFSTSSIKQSEAKNGQVMFSFSDTFDVSDGDTVTIKIGINNGVASRYKSFYNGDFYISADNLSGSKWLNNAGVSYSASTSTFTISFVSDNDYKNLHFDFNFYIGDCDYPDSNFIIGCTSCDVNIKSQSSSFFDNIKEWFSNLFELLISKFKELGQNITEIGQNVGEWFSNLTESLRTFFSNLTQSIQSFFSELREKIVEQFNNMIQNLQQWFKNVGQWFNDLGEKISGFFSDLWQNFKNFFDEIGQKISDWWQSVKDFFHSLFVPEDGYFDSYKQNWETWAREHFALFYDVMDFVDDVFELFLTEFGDSSHLVITIPELSLPVLDHNVFMQETSFDFGEFINTHSSFKYLYNLYRVLISGAFYFLLLKYLQKTLSEIIVGDGDVL